MRRNNIKFGSILFIPPKTRDACRCCKVCPNHQSLVSGQYNHTLQAIKATGHKLLNLNQDSILETTQIDFIKCLNEPNKTSLPVPAVNAKQIKRQ